MDIMKGGPYQLTTQEVALVAVLLAAIIASHMLAPTAAAAIVSIASTLIGAFFVNRNAKPDGPNAPVLTLVPKSDGEDK